MAESIEEDITRLLTNCVALSDYCSKYLCSLAYKRNMHLWYVGFGMLQITAWHATCWIAFFVALLTHQGSVGWMVDRKSSVAS